VTILAILTILLGVLILIVGVVLLVASAFLVGLFPPVFGLGVTVIGGIVFVFGLLWLAVGVGLLNLRGWAWWLAIIVMVLSIIGSIGTPVFAILPGLILVYLILVRHHFR
jgi:hypothetical protein